MFSNYLVEFEILANPYIIRGSLFAYQIGYVADRCLRRQFQTLISINANEIQILKNSKSFCGKKTLATALGFEPRSFLLPQKDFEFFKI